MVGVAVKVSDTGGPPMENQLKAVVSDLVAMGLAVPLPKKAEKQAEKDAKLKEKDRPS